MEVNSSCDVANVPSRGPLASARLCVGIVPLGGHTAHGHGGARGSRSRGVEAPRGVELPDEEVHREAQRPAVRPARQRVRRPALFVRRARACGEVVSAGVRHREGGAGPDAVVVPLL